MWVFGNAICAKVGNAWYAPMWVGFGLVSAIAEPTGLGASGAIYGIIGFTLVFYPVNDVTMAYWIVIRFGTFTLPSYALVIIYLAFDIFGLVTGDEAVAYLSHIAGCAAGVGLALVLLTSKRVVPTEQEWTVIDLLTRHDKTRARGQRGSVVTDRLYVRLPSGQVKTLRVDEFIRHEQQGKPVNQFPVSEDGKSWTTFGKWRANRP